MATQEVVSDALNVLHVTRRAISRPGSRLHKDGMEEGDALRNALEHPCCGFCDRLTVNVYWGQGRDQISLGCEKKHSPRNMWINWSPGDNPITCIDCTDPDGRPVEER